MEKSNNFKNSPFLRVSKPFLKKFGLDAAVIVELQGYKIHSPRTGELAKIFNGNQITIEHRFFEDSKPIGEIPWEHLTVRNAATDQHIIIEALKKAVYPENKFLSIKS